MGPILTVALPVTLAVVMLGLGLALTTADFTRVLTAPKAVLLSLACQLVVLPLLCFGMVKLVGLSPVFAVGMMILVASPGGTTANLFSHLAKGDVALNVTLTAINSVVAVVTLPLIVGLSMSHFLADDANIGLQPDKLVQVFGYVLVPVAIGMWLNRAYPRFAERMRGPVKKTSVIVLVFMLIGTVVQNRETIFSNIDTIGGVALALTILSFTIGYWVPKLAGVNRQQAIASAMEIGVHNAVLAMAVAASVFDSLDMVIPSAVYGTLMFVPAGLAALYFARREARIAAAERERPAEVIPG
ncbi:bile acid:sodium symporter [Actinophytocola xinjiangensis]|uniref:Bile acid:sodium symporter n=1 Tax=Actinophytocola xinjiangensis TaxID=485602 RepID=A0A7Z0WEW4_9PSEU|nr:bile acid:sodium symporter family protein [Actinophytocola xinjiangensis]OLF05227.1 bile acid:sodium symporter [Actinophytocola xinjiangensis]